MMVCRGRDNVVEVIIILLTRKYKPPILFRLWEEVSYNIKLRLFCSFIRVNNTRLLKIRHIKWASLMAQMVKNLDRCNSGDPDSIHGMGRSPGERNGHPLPGEFHRQRSSEVYTPWYHEELDKWVSDIWTYKMWTILIICSKMIAFCICIVLLFKQSSFCFSTYILKQHIKISIFKMKDFQNKRTRTLNK